MVCLDACHAKAEPSMEVNKTDANDAHGQTQIVRTVWYQELGGQRHAGASVLDSQNVPLGTIQRILGHENRSTIEIYLHSMGHPEREAMEVFEAANGFSPKDSHTESHTGNRIVSHTPAPD